MNTLNGENMPKKTSTKKPAVKPVVPPAPLPVAAPVAPVRPMLTEADKIWAEIKDKPIEMFGLPDQTVGIHCTPITVEPSKLYVTIRSAATLPSLEAAIAKGFTVELADKFVIVTRKPLPVVYKK